MPEVASTRAASRWTTRIIPFVVATVVSYGTYVIVASVCGESRNPQLLLTPLLYPWCFLFFVSCLFLFFILFYFILNLLTLVMDGDP